MKYMHFNSSCPYASIANQLELFNYDTEDFKIALDMGLPYFSRYDVESKTYLSGATLQSKEWFDLYLKPRGFQYIEKVFHKKDLLNQLQKGMMLGIYITPEYKHAVIFLKNDNEKYIFINNKWESSSENSILQLSKYELLNKLPDYVHVGYIEQCMNKDVSLYPYYQESILTWERIKKEIDLFVNQNQTPHNLRQSMNRYFRPLLVDGLAMMKLINEIELVNQLESLQKEFMLAIKKNQALTLSEEFDCTLFNKTINKIINLISNKMKDNKRYYHGSIIPNIKKLETRSLLHNTDEKVLYLTSNIPYALVYIWDENKNHYNRKHVTCGIRNGKVFYEEKFPNQLETFYKGVSGYLYVVDRNNTYEVNNREYMYYSRNNKLVTDTIFISDVYEELLKYEALGEFKIVRYHEQSEEKKKELNECTAYYLIKNNMLENDNEQANFMKMYYNTSWEIAIRNLNNENFLKEMEDKYLCH